MHDHVLSTLEQHPLVPKLTRFTGAIALLAVISGCSTTNPATAAQETTLTLQGPTTRADTPSCGFQLLRVEPDGTVILTTQDRKTTISGKPGQILGSMQTTDRQWRVIIMSSDPVLQQATIREEPSRKTRAAFR